MKRDNTARNWFVAYMLPIIIFAVMISFDSFFGIARQAEAQVGRSPVACGLSVPVDFATASTVELVPVTAGRRVHVCGFALTGGGVTSARFVRGTGTNCGTGTANVTGAMELADNVNIAMGGGVGALFILPVGQALCVTNGAAIQLSGFVSYSR